VLDVHDGVARIRSVVILSGPAVDVVVAALPVQEVGVRVRKPKAPIDGIFDYAGVEIWRQKSGSNRHRLTTAARYFSAPAR